jgi:hypothetical protein
MLASGRLQNAVVLASGKEIRRQHALPVYKFNFRLNPIKARGTELEIKLIGIVFHVIEVMVKHPLADEIINLIEGLFWLPRESFVSHEYQAIGISPEEGFAQGIQRKADKSVASG